MVVHGIMGGVSSKVDGTWSLRFSTQELSTEQITSLIEARNKFGVLVFEETEKQAAESVVEARKMDVDAGQKTISQRIRGALFVLWDQKGRQGTFDDYYNKMGENIINQIKEHLE